MGQYFFMIWSVNLYCLLNPVMNARSVKFCLLPCCLYSRSSLFLFFTCSLALINFFWSYPFSSNLCIRVSACDLKSLTLSQFLLSLLNWPLGMFSIHLGWWQLEVGMYPFRSVALKKVLVLNKLSSLKTCKSVTVQTDLLWCPQWGWMIWVWL